MHPTRKASDDKPRLGMRSPRRPAVRMGEDQALPRSPTVLLLVDVINPLDFPGARRLEPQALAAARAIARFKPRARRAGWMCVYANDNYGQWRSDFREVLASCEERGGVAGEIARMLAPEADDLVILKPRQSAFFATPLDLVLGQMHTQRLVVAGLSTDICVQLSAMDADLRGYALWVPSDCTAAESPALKRQALGYMARVLDANTRATTHGAR
jgi:nicotinamidase-related amidase